MPQGSIQGGEENMDPDPKPTAVIKVQKTGGGFVATLQIFEPMLEDAVSEQPDPEGDPT